MMDFELFFFNAIGRESVKLDIALVKDIGFSIGSNSLHRKPFKFVD